jgi:hypothetical protein
VLRIQKSTIVNATIIDVPSSSKKDYRKMRQIMYQAASPQDDHYAYLDLFGSTRADHVGR